MEGPDVVSGLLYCLYERTRDISYFTNSVHSILISYVLYYCYHELDKEFVDEKIFVIRNVS